MTEIRLWDLQKITHKNEIFRSKRPNILELRTFNKFSNDPSRNKIQENLYLSFEDIFSNDITFTQKRYIQGSQAPFNNQA